MFNGYRILIDEYYKCKRENSVSGSQRLSFEFYDDMDEVLGDRPLSNSGTFQYESVYIPSKFFM